jgi:hypothetical protein
MGKSRKHDLLGNCLGIILAFSIVLTTACSEEKNKSSALVYVDTITLPYRSAKAWQNYYHPFFDRTISTFIQENPLEIVAVDPETLEHISFPLDKVYNHTLNLSYPAAYYVLDSTSALISFINLKNQFFKIGRDGSIQSIIPIVDNRKSKEYGLYYYSKLIPLPDQGSDDSLKLIENFTADFPGNHLYITNKELRNKKFSAKTNLLIKLCDTSLIVTEEFGNYPEELTNSKDYYYYEPRFCIAPNNQVINIFPSINILGVISEKNQTRFFDFQIPKSGPVKTFKTELQMDYRYLSQYCYENNLWLYMYADSEASCYYAITTIAAHYENTDGTVNDPTSSPWALITLDDSLNMRRIDYFKKDELSKHEFFFSSKYWYILDYQLTDKNPNKHITFIKIKKPKA